jgi:hypothetical protein
MNKFLRAQSTVAGVISRSRLPFSSASMVQRVGTGECEKCKKKKEGMLQRRASNSMEPTAVPPIVHDVLRSPGQPLDVETRAFFEPRFGHNFIGVRPHTD